MRKWAVSFTVASALRWWAQECPDRIAISVEDKPLTYSELWSWSARLGQFLIDNNVQHGERVIILGANSMEYAVLQVALMRIGAVNCPVNFRSSAQELSKSISTLTPTHIFADAERLAVAQSAASEGSAIKVFPLAEIAKLEPGNEDTPHIAHEPDPEDPLFIIGTSGSTGAPKGVVENHRTVVAYSAEFVLMEPQCGSGASILVVGPFSSSSGTLVMFQFLTSGATVYLESQFRPARALELLTKHKITIFLAATIFFERIAALEEFQTADLSSLYFSQAGGARVSTSLLAAWRAKGAILRQAYGCTEAGGAWAARNDVALSSPEKAGRGGIFSRYAILGDDGKFAPPGVTGEILVQSASVTPGYWNNPEATAEAIMDGWLRTGDLGFIDETGNITFVDRLKDIIISGGLNISAKEIEDVIAELDGVEEVAVIAAKHDNFGETPLAIIYGDTQKVTAEIVTNACLEHLARFKAPRYVVFEDEHLPRVLSGKISKPQLREKYKDAHLKLTETR